jgi:teichoic acid transport system permease protein
MAIGNLTARNASTTLGLFWWVLNPLLLGMIYYLVFGIILGISRDLAYLLSGMFVFFYTTTSLTGGANSIISNSKLIVNLSFPRLIMPIVAVTEAGIGFLASLPALYVIIIPSQGIWPPIRILWLLPVIFVIHTVFNLGLAALAGRVAVPFRDVNNLIPYLTRLWLYLSPILYTTEVYDRLPDPWNSIAKVANPMVPIIGVYQAALLGYEFRLEELVAAIVWAVGVAAIAITAFVKYEGRMARYL